ncbi:helix-turn-helix domain-containing protein [Nocardia asteroides]|uniref:helix-turn-helix domain-containing protein n=1 Tax=Nocardia asteroides TaxID=1824 RepID=UPI0034381021
MTLIHFRLQMAGLVVDARVERQHEVAAVTAETAVTDRDARIVELHEAGASTRRIGAEVGLHHSHVARILARTERTTR